MRVLIVEDEAIIALHLAILVAEFGHEVCATAGSAAGAIALATLHNPHVVVMDVRLADGSSGIDAARELHAQQALRCIFPVRIWMKQQEEHFYPMNQSTLLGSRCRRSCCSEP